MRNAERRRVNVLKIKVIEKFGGSDTNGSSYECRAGMGCELATRVDQRVLKWFEVEGGYGVYHQG